MSTFDDALDASIRNPTSRPTVAQRLREEALAKPGPLVCTLCGTTVNPPHVTYECNHVDHLHCVREKIKLNRAGCQQCPGPFKEIPPIDTGNDAHVRRLLQSALIAQVSVSPPPRTITVQRCKPTTNPTGRPTPLDRTPGGPPDPESLATSITCTRSDCTGPQTCLHRYMPANLSAQTVSDWRRYVFTPPLSLYDTKRARAIVRNLFTTRADPHDWIRSGATLPVLAALDVPLSSLAREFSLQGLVEPPFNLTALDMHAFDWHPVELQDHDLFPVPHLPLDMTADRLITDYAVTHADLAQHLDEVEIFYLGFRGPHYKFANATYEKILMDLSQQPKYHDEITNATFLYATGLLTANYLKTTNAQLNAILALYRSQV